MMNITDIPPVRIVVCGHINHGKSTLIGRIRLSCLPKAENSAEADRIPPEFITDHLAEERRYAKTVDTTHICFQRCGRPYILKIPGLVADRSGDQQDGPGRLL